MVERESTNALDKEDFKEAATHLRSIHFALLIVCIACIAVILGYKNTVINGAYNDVTLILASIEPINNVLGSSNRNTRPELTGKQDNPKIHGVSYTSFKNDWASLSNQVTPENIALIKRDGEEIAPDSQLFIQLFSQTWVSQSSSTAFDNCSYWYEIERSDSSEFSQNYLKDRGVTSELASCAWLSEDRLYVVPIEYKQVDTFEVTVAGIEQTTEPSNGELVGSQIVYSSSDLDSCANWGDIARLNFESFSQHIESINQPFICGWLGEDKLKVKTLSDVKYSAPLVVTEKGIVIDAYNTDVGTELLNNRLTTIHTTEQLTSCPGDGPYVITNTQALTGLMNTIRNQNNTTFCFWLNEEYLLTGKPKFNSTIPLPPFIYNKIGLSFELAFPSLNQLYEESQIPSYRLRVEPPYEFELEPENSMNMGIKWESVGISALEEILKKNRWAIGPTNIAGLPIKQELLLNGAPLILIVIQLYFILHFHQLKLTSVVAPCVVPWIALYRDVLSRLISTLTIIVLPPLTTVIYCIQEILPGGRLMSLCICAVSICIALVQFYLFITAWKTQNVIKHSN